MLNFHICRPKTFLFLRNGGFEIFKASANVVANTKFAAINFKNALFGALPPALGFVFHKKHNASKHANQVWSSFYSPRFGIPTKSVSNTFVWY